MPTVKTKVKDPELIRKKQQQLCGGAMKVFRTKGFHAASIREIARAAGMSLGSVYDYIERKEDILFLVHNEVLDRIYSHMDAVVERIDDPREQLFTVMSELIELSFTLKEEMLFIYTETKSLDKWYLHEILKRESEFVDKFTALIEAGVKAGVFDCPHPGMTANLIVFMGAVIPLRGWNILPQGSPGDVVEALTDMAARIILTK